MADSTSSQGALNERLDFIGMDQRARESLRRLRPLIVQAIVPALTAFYDKVRATPETRRFFTDEKHIAGAKERQEQHWGIIAAADYAEDYVENVKKVGRTHARIGLEPRWYIGGYAVVIEQLIHAVLKQKSRGFLRLTRGRPEDMAEGLSNLIKAAMLDMDLAISVYIETLDDQRRRAEEAARDAIKQEREFVANSIGVGLAKLAAKDLTYRMSETMPEAYRALQGDLNAAIAHLEEAMARVTVSSATIRVGAQEISTAADDLGRRTEQQAAGLEETSAALSEITKTVSDIAGSAGQADQIVVAAKDKAEKSRVVVRQAVDAMNDIQKSSQAIGKIISVIDDMAFQTNLLALNAGVEAARAGDAGRGFAVVAAEVRALAQRSAEAAKEIKGLILASATQVERGVQLVRETDASLEQIAGQVTETEKAVSRIAVGAKQQATALHEVNVAMNQMDQVTQQNAAMAQESTAACRSLSQETDRLGDQVDQFRVGESSRRDADALPAKGREPRRRPAA